MHVSDDILLAFLDREVEAGERYEIGEHVDRCEACAARLAELRAATRHAREALESLDVGPPWAGMPARLADAASGEGGAESIRTISTAPSARRARRLSGRAMAVAASLVLLLAAGAWAIPGSPIRAWLSQSAASVVELFGSGAPETTAADRQDATDSGVFVEPLGGQVRISVHEPGAGTLVRISLTDAPRASVRATGPGGSYRVGPGSIEVVEPSGEMVIQIPSEISDARVEIDGRVVVRKRGEELYLTPAADSSTAQILLQTGG